MYQDGGPLGFLGPFNPFGVAGDIAGKAVAEGWTGIMVALWSAGLWVLRMALGLMDKWLTPDISSGGPAAEIYKTTFWGAGALVLIMSLVQLGVAAFRRDGKSLARVLIGAAQFAMVWGAWITYGIAVIAACGGLSRALMSSLLKINNWSEWKPMPDFDFAKSGIEIGLATVLGILGLFLWIAAIGHFLIMLTRAAALLILTAMTPLAAAGLVSEAGRSWFWKSLRWFHAAAFTPVLTVLVMGLGVKLTSGVAQGGTQTADAAIGTAFPGVMLILVSVVAPVSLFRLLAFVDPGTSSGAAMRAGMSSAGGLQGLLTGGAGGGQGGTTSAASQSTGGGQSQGEAQSNAATSGRFGQALAGIAGPAGAAYAAGLGMVTKAGSTAASVGIDDMNQTGVGDSSYFPDYQRGSQRFNPDQRDPGSTDDGQNPDAASSGSDGSTPSVPMPPIPAGVPTAGGSPGGGGGGGGGMPKPPGGAGGGGGASGGGAAAAAEIPPIV